MRINTEFVSAEAAKAHVSENKLVGVVVVDCYCNYKEKDIFLIVTPDEVEKVKEESNRNWDLVHGPVRDETVW